MKERMIERVWEKLERFLMRIPFPYRDILREQINTSEICFEGTPDCCKILFHCPETVRPFPEWMPAMPQGSSIGSLSCQLFVEHGYIAALEVADMAGKPINWEVLWSDNIVYDAEYDISSINRRLTAGTVCILRVSINPRLTFLELESRGIPVSLCLWNSRLAALDLSLGRFPCRMEIGFSEMDGRGYLIRTDDNRLAIECSLISMQRR